MNSLFLMLFLVILPRSGAAQPDSTFIKALFTAITKTRGWRMPGIDEGVKIKGKI
ncbi:hypothetical protein [Pedobacter ginsengisoli]|uniref:hypothetical protein n=1 Tax=Pedobacter ginsengisoli TaxID=363852 RepID=UPI00254C79EC|nr:hypothetical protein [Pedobacter ginsengisoli]